MIFEASVATSVNEKQEINILFKKFTRDVLIYSPESSDLSEKAIAWTTKSIVFHFFLISLKTFEISLSFSTLHSKTIEELISFANGVILFFKN